MQDLIGGLFPPSQAETVFRMAAAMPLDFEALVQLDAELGWACISNVNNGNVGNYHVDDRDVFRPLQYCAGYLHKMSKGGGHWLTRHTVHMAALHVECLAERIGLSHKLPLGRTIREKIFRQKVDHETWNLIDGFCRVYNAAKHDVEHEKDTHMFSIEDAVLAYFVGRAIGNRLSHLVEWRTEWAQDSSGR